MWDDEKDQRVSRLATNVKIVNYIKSLTWPLFKALEYIDFFNLIRRREIILNLRTIKEFSKVQKLQRSTYNLHESTIYLPVYFHKQMGPVGPSITPIVHSIEQTKDTNK